jgi:uncharacterized repeat protein (TIGR03803 family)
MSSMPILLRRFPAAFGLLWCLAGTPALATDTYSAGQLTMPAVAIGGATFSNMVVTIGAIVSGPNGSSPVGTVDRYDPATQQLTVPAVSVGAATYYNVIAKVTSLVSVGAVSGADTVSGSSPFVLSIPVVQLAGGAVYHDVIVTVAGIRSAGGGMPTSAMDIYDGANGQLTIAAVTVGGRVYTNAVVTVGAILTETLIHSFGVTGTGDGQAPQAGLIQGTDGLLVGTTSGGGALAPRGTVFSLSPGGTETLLHDFTGGVGPSTDGYGIGSPVIQASDGNFYGTAYQGGAFGYGCVYKVTPQGTETVLYSFAGGPGDGAGPLAAVIQGSDGNLYGTTSRGGASQGGTVFKLSLSGNETLLYSFTLASVAPQGYEPGAALVEGTDGNFYGSTIGGGNTIFGTIFRITPTGTLTTLYAFSPTVTPGDATGPFSELVEGSDGNFYGTSRAGGASDMGTVFRITPAGAETILHSFSGNPAGATAADGEGPAGGLVEGSPGIFYGTTALGGRYATGLSPYAGTIFKVTASGQETIVYSFGAAPRDGASPSGTLLHAADGFYYGTTELGGAFGYGSVFRIADPLP